MSIVKFVALFCDEEGCLNDPADFGLVDVKQTRNFARTEGWTYQRASTITGETRGRDFCPEHSR